MENSREQIQMSKSRRERQDSGAVGVVRTRKGLEHKSQKTSGYCDFAIMSRWICETECEPRQRVQGQDGNYGLN